MPRQINLQAVIATAVRVLGKVATALGDYEEARKLMWESLAIARETGDQLRIARALRNLGLVAENLGQLAEAVNYYQESLVLFRVVGNQMGTAGALANLGSIAVLRGNSREARRLFEEAHRTTELLSLVLEHPASDLQDKERARHVLDELASELGPEMYAMGIERGKSLDLEEVVAEILGEATK